MADDKTAPIPPTEVTIIGTGTGGSPLTTGTLAATPNHQPNLVVRVITPMVAITVRFINLFLTTLVGLLVAGMTPAGSHLLYTSDFVHLVATCAGLAVPGAGLGFLKDCVTVFGKLEAKFPLATGSV